MKKSNYIKVGALLFSLILTSCNLLPQNAARRKSSSQNDISSENNESSEEIISSRSTFNYSSYQETPPTSRPSSSYSRQTSSSSQRPSSSIAQTSSYYSEPVSSSPSSSSKTSKHTHYANEGDPWENNNNYHWQRCADGDGGKVNNSSHVYGEPFDVIESTCTDGGQYTHQCTVCKYQEIVYTSPFGHDIESSTPIIIQEATCTMSGYATKTCSRCHQQITIILDPLNHDLVAYNNDAEPEAGKARASVYACTRGDLTYMTFSVADVTPESKTRLVYEYDGGARFWGRPIGNDVALDENGQCDPDDHNPVYNENQLGDYFELVFDLTDEQAELMKDCRLYCDAQPAQYMYEGGLDFWARRQNDSEWTPGIYIDDNPNTTNNEQGKEVTDYRYVLYVDNVLQKFDSKIKAPVLHNNQRDEYVMPYTFHLHAGENRIRLHMAGGYRSTFYNFTFRSVEAEEEEPSNYETVRFWSGSEMIQIATNCGYPGSVTKVWDENTEGFKFNRTDCAISFDFESSLAEEVELQLLLSVKISNKTKTGFWRQDDKEKTRITFNGVQLGPIDGNDLDFTNVTESEVTDNGLMSIPEWFSISPLQLLVGSNTLSMQYLGTGYTYYICGMRLVKAL